MKTYRLHLINIFIFKFIAIFVLIISCEHADPVEPDQQNATFSSIQSTIFNQNCAISGCHLGGSAPLGLELSEANAYGNLVNVPSQGVPSLLRVEPNEPDSSYLVRKLEGGPNIVGAQMPRGRAPLSQDEIDLIRQWIDDGAKNN